MPPALGVITALAGLATAGVGIANAFNKPKSNAAQVTAPDVTQTPGAASTDPAAKLGALALVNTSPQGASSASTGFGRSQLLGG